MADRLRAEAEEELSVLRSAHQDVERELAAAQQRQKEADVHLATLREELKESRQKLAALSSSRPERPNGEQEDGSESKERPQKTGMEERSQSDAGRNVASEEGRTDCRGVTKRYLRNLISEDKSGEEVHASETRRPLTSERSR